jgi:hypothetical protein
MKQQYVAETCRVVCEDNDRTMTADILSFKLEQYLAVSLEKSLKLEMRWNGRVYEGRMGKFSFVSDGPKITEVKQGR